MYSHKEFCQGGTYGDQVVWCTDLVSSLSSGRETSDQDVAISVFDF